MACSFSEHEVTIVASISTVTKPPPVPGAVSPASSQARYPQRLGQQQATGLGDDSGAARGHHDLGMLSGKLHAESAFRTGQDRTLDKPYSSRSRALFVSK